MASVTGRRADKRPRLRWGRILPLIGHSGRLLDGDRPSARLQRALQLLLKRRRPLTISEPAAYASQRPSCQTYAGAAGALALTGLASPLLVRGSQR